MAAADTPDDPTGPTGSPAEPPTGPDLDVPGPDMPGRDSGRQVPAADPGTPDEAATGRFARHRSARNARIESARAHANSKAHELTDPAPQRDHGKAGRDLPAAIAVGVVLGAFLVFTLGWWPLGFVILVGLALALGAFELHMALQRLGMRAALAPIMVGSFGIVIAAYFAGKQDQIDLPSNTLMLAMIGITALVTMIWRMPRGEENYVKDVAASMFIIGYLPLQGSFIGLMLAQPQGQARVVTYIVAVCLGDIGGYVFGVLFGKHKMAPKVSPKKTWEGAIGSLVFGIAAAVGLSMWLLDAQWWMGIVLGVVLVAVGICGDLIESLIKRDIGIKDMSSILPGHGGVMDRIDSLVVAAPAAWFMMFLMFPGATG